MEPPEQPPASAPAGTQGTRLTGSEAVKAHLTLTVGLALCVAAFWFEIKRALGGNELSWAYVFEWPLIAGFAVYLWWNVLHQNRGRKRAAAEPAVVAPEHLGMLKAWQEQQRQLAQSQAEPGGAAGSGGTGGPAEPGS